MRMHIYGQCGNHAAARVLTDLIAGLSLGCASAVVIIGLRQDSMQSFRLLPLYDCILLVVLFFIFCSLLFIGKSATAVLRYLSAPVSAPLAILMGLSTVIIATVYTSLIVNTHALATNPAVSRLLPAFTP